jgi:hypothetical protein
LLQNETFALVGDYVLYYGFADADCSFVLCGVAFLVRIDVVAKVMLWNTII